MFEEFGVERSGALGDGERRRYDWGPRGGRGEIDETGEGVSFIEQDCEDRYLLFLGESIWR